MRRRNSRTNDAELAKHEEQIYSTKKIGKTEKTRPQCAGVTVANSQKIKQITEPT